MSSAQRAINITQLEQEPLSRTKYDNSFLLKNKEPSDSSNETQCSYKFPTEGKVEFKNVVMSYSKKGNAVLKGVSFFVKPGQKVAFVGRTGAGKSSILQALFRMFEIQKPQPKLQSMDQLFNVVITQPNQITQENYQDEVLQTLDSNYDSFISIDNHNILELGVKTLREGFSIIPQIPFIFTGTLKTNLDPHQKYSDEEIWQVIRDIKLENKIRGLPAQLETEISNSSESFSTGQKQLICLGRALLKKSKILVLDEVTSSCDAQTEELILELINTKFVGSTIIAIAHRLTTIADYDQIIVMDKGQIAEQGTSQELLSIKNGIFTKMVKSSGKSASALIHKTKHKKNKKINTNKLS